MLCSIYGYRLSQHRLVIGLSILLVAGGLCACASMPSESTHDNRTCDAWADAAVASEQWSQAVERHEKLLGTDASNCLAMYHLGYILGQLDDHSQEILWYQNAVACGYAQNDTLYFNLGMAYKDLGRLEAANDAFKQAVALDPDKADNHFGLGLTAHTRGKAGVAERALKKAISVSPHHWDARILLVKIYLDQGRLSSAEGHLAYLMERLPHNDEVIHLYERYKKRQTTAYD